MTPPDPLRDPIWQFIGVIAGIVIGIITGFILPLVLFRRQTRKSLTYAIISNTLILPTLDVGDQAKNKLQVLFEGKQVNGARLIVLKVWNSGSIPIEVDDYENHNPIKFNFGEKAEVLNVEILETIPSNLKPRANASLKADGSKIALEPLLLNGQDVITLKVLLAHLGDSITVDETRISGVKQIQFSDQAIDRNVLTIQFVYWLINILFTFAKWSLGLVGIAIVAMLSNLVVANRVDLPYSVLFFLLRIPGVVASLSIYVFIISMIFVLKALLPHYLKK